MNKKGFTLIELLLVVMVIGFMLAVIVPRGMRASTDAKYNIVRQNCSELAAYGNQWIEEQILAQDADSTATRGDYLKTLTNLNNINNPATWIAYDQLPSNWNLQATLRRSVLGRKMNLVNNARPETAVEGLIEPAKIPRNPFNGVSIFRSPNAPADFGSRVVPGAIACARADDSSTGGTFEYYAFIFQGTDSTHYEVAAWAADFHGGMSATSLSGLREGVFFTKVRK